MTPKDQTDAMATFNADFQQDYFRLEDDSFVGITEGAFNSAGEWVFEVNDDFVEKSNKPEKEGVMAWRTAYKNYVEDIAQGVVDRITPTDKTSAIMSLQERDERQATSQAIANQKAQLAVQKQLDNSFGATKSSSSAGQYDVNLPSGTLSVNIPKTNVDDGSEYKYADTNIMDDGIAGLSNVAVQKIIYDYNDGNPYPLSIVLNSQKGVSGSQYVQKKSAIKEYTVSYDDAAFGEIWGAITNKQSVYEKLSPVPLKMYALENNMITESELNQGGFDYDKAMNAANGIRAQQLVPVWLR